MARVTVCAGGTRRMTDRGAVLDMSLCSASSSRP